MERYFNFEEVHADVASAIEAAVRRHGIDIYHPIAVAGVIEAIASPLKFHKLQGTPLTTPLGIAGSEAYEVSCLVRKVEEIKSPHSLIVNPMMDAVVAALTRAPTLTMSALFENAQLVFMRYIDPNLSQPENAWSGDPQTNHAFNSALSYLIEGNLIRELPSCDVRTFELAVGYDLALARSVPED